MKNQTKKITGKILILCLSASLIINLSGINSFADSSDDDWSGNDKAVHTAVSGTACVLFYYYYQKNTDWDPGKLRLAAFLSTLALGAAKELTDDDFSWKDMGANSLGAAIGVGITWKF